MSKVNKGTNFSLKVEERVPPLPSCDVCSIYTDNHCENFNWSSSKLSEEKAGQGEGFVSTNMCMKMTSCDPLTSECNLASLCCVCERDTYDSESRWQLSCIYLSF